MIKSLVSLPIGLSYGKRKGTVLIFLRNEFISLAGQGLMKQAKQKISTKDGFNN